jgi:hypothetical protein
VSITSDIRSYADNAVSQGKQVLDQAIDTAQASLNDVTGQAGDFVGRAQKNVNDLRASAEKAVNLDAVSTAVEPYIAQFREYTTAVTDRVEHAVDGLRSDKRVAALIDQAEALGNTVVETLNERVVKPVQSLTGRSTSSSAKPASKPTPKPRPSATSPSRPAAKSAPRKPATTKPASKTAARKTAN